MSGKSAREGGGGKKRMTMETKTDERMAGGGME